MIITLNSLSGRLLSSSSGVSLFLHWGHFLLLPLSASFCFCFYVLTMSLVFPGLGEVETFCGPGGTPLRSAKLGAQAVPSTGCPGPSEGLTTMSPVGCQALPHTQAASHGWTQSGPRAAVWAARGCLELVLACWWVGLCPMIKALWSVWRWSEVWPGDGFLYRDNAHIHIKMLWKLLSRNTTSLSRLVTWWNWLQFPFERLLLWAPCYAGIHDLRRRGFQSEFRDEAWLLGAFCIAKFY